MARRTRPPQQPIDARFPDLLPLQRVAVRLHPHRVAAPLPPSASKIGGHILWPEEEPWPVCTEREYAVEPVTPPQPVAVTDLLTGRSYGPTWIGPEDRRHTGTYLPILQVRRADVPELPFPDDSDLFQLVWCPRLHEEDYQPRIRLYWRREREITHPRASFPRPIALTSDDAADSLVPRYECAVAPERILEYPSLTELEQMGLIPDDASEDLWDAQNRGELGTAHGGTKVGGWPVWSQEPVALTCPRGHEMRYLLSFETCEPLEELILSPDEQEILQHLDARRGGGVQGANGNGLRPKWVPLRVLMSRMPGSQRAFRHAVSADVAHAHMTVARASGVRAPATPTSPALQLALVRR